MAALPPPSKRDPAPPSTPVSAGRGRRQTKAPCCAGRRAERLGVACRPCVAGRRRSGGSQQTAGARRSRGRTQLRFGVGIARNRKQLWLRDNRAYLPHDKELIRVLELCDVVADTYDDANAGRGAMSSGEAASNGISGRMCEGQATRASLRERRLNNCIAAQRALNDATTCHLHRACLKALTTAEP